MQIDAKPSAAICHLFRNCLALAVGFVAMLALCSAANAQRERGELQIEVKDPQGQAAFATGVSYGPASKASIEAKSWTE